MSVQSSHSRTGSSASLVSFRTPRPNTQSGGPTLVFSWQTFVCTWLYFPAHRESWSGSGAVEGRSRPGELQSTPLSRIKNVSNHWSSQRGPLNVVTSIDLKSQSLQSSRLLKWTNQKILNQLSVKHHRSLLTMTAASVNRQRAIKARRRSKLTKKLRLSWKRHFPSTWDQKNLKNHCRRRKRRQWSIQLVVPSRRK